jgi:hypothetical protein
MKINRQPLANLNSFYQTVIPGTIKQFLYAGFIVCLSVMALPASAKTSRALIIGIDLYKPANDKTENTTRVLWRNLNGCVNDAMAIKDLVVARYSFPEENIRTLFNQAASREKILAELNYLLATAEKGDVVFIYYAGHGSQVVNSLSKEQDKRDESIVPADAYKGAKDIRDKELAALFNALIDKGVILTVIFDSCHSGSAGRGQLYAVEGIRNLDPDSNDAADPSDPAKPEERGALIISAAQDFEFAKEIADENNIMHGAFTLALLKSLQLNPANASVENIFSGLQAILKYYGKTQEPVLAGSEERKKGNLFGLSKVNASEQISIPVFKTEGQKIELMGGYAFGLSTGQTLKALNSPDTLIITDMSGANRSFAKKISRSKSVILPGSLFEPINWTSASGAALKIYISLDVIDQKSFNESIISLRALKNDKTSNIINDLSKKTPDRIIHFGDNTWWFQQPGGNKVQEKTLQKIIRKEKNAVYVDLPPEQKFAAALKDYFSHFDNIELVTNPADALYSLTGRLNERNEPEYAFVRNNFSVRDSLEVLPLRTDFEIYDPKIDPALTAQKLADNTFKIARIRNWMMLQPPEGINRFPYSLEVVHYRTGIKPLGNAVNLKDTLSFFISKIPSGEKWNRKKRYVYVFSIDANGAMKLLFPQASRGNIENRFPLTDEINNTESKSRLFDIRVTPPGGNDVYFLLSTEEPISNLSAFQQPGVISRGPANAPSGIESLLFTGTRSRNKITTPLTWSIEKLVLHINPTNK